MKVKIPLVLLLLIGVAIGYLLGTESGREQRDIILVKMGRGPEAGDDASAAAEGAAQAAESASDAPSEVGAS